MLVPCHPSLVTCDSSGSLSATQVWGPLQGRLHLSNRAHTRPTFMESLWHARLEEGVGILTFIWRLYVIAG